MSFTQKCAVLSLVFTCLAPSQGFGATAESSGILANQSLYGFKLSIVNMPIDAGALFRGPGLVRAANITSNHSGTAASSVQDVLQGDPMQLGLMKTRPEYARLLQAKEAYEWQISYGVDDFSLFIGANLGFSSDDEDLGIIAVNYPSALQERSGEVQLMNAQGGLYDPAAWLTSTDYWRIGGAYQAMDWLTLSLNFQQELTYEEQNLIYLSTQVQLNRVFSVELIGLVGNDASKGALLKTSYHF